MDGLKHLAKPCTWRDGVPSHMLVLRVLERSVGECKPGNRDEKPYNVFMMIFMCVLSIEPGMQIMVYS